MIILSLFECKVTSALQPHDTGNFLAIGGSDPMIQGRPDERSKGSYAFIQQELAVK